MDIRSVGVIGLGKMAMPIAELLVKGGYRVLGFRRSSMASFESFGDVRWSRNRCVDDPATIYTAMRRMLPGERLFTPVNDLLIILSAIAHAIPSSSAVQPVLLHGQTCG